MSWYLMHRGWMDNPAFRDDWDRLRWVWLIENAVWEESYTTSINNNPVNLNRGQLSYSLRYLSKAWSCSEKKVRNFLKHLEKWRMIDTEKGTGQTIVTICNYRKYQKKDTEKGTGPEQNGAQDGRRVDANTKEGTKKDKEYKDYTVEFSEFWSAYPKRDGSNPRKPARLKFIAACKSHEPEEIILGAKKYAAQEKRKGNAGTPYIAQAQTWLNQERWKDEYDTGKTKRQNYIGM